MRCQLTQVRVAVFNKSTNNQCWRGCGEKGTLVHGRWECRPEQPLWKTVRSFLKNLKMELPYDPAIPLLGIHPKKPETLITKNIYNFMFIASLFTIAKSSPFCSHPSRSVQNQRVGSLPGSQTPWLCVRVCVCVCLFIHSEPPCPCSRTLSLFILTAFLNFAGFPRKRLKHLPPHHTLNRWPLNIGGSESRSSSHLIILGNDPVLGPVRQSPVPNAQLALYVCWWKKWKNQVQLHSFFCSHFPDTLSLR